MPNIIKKEMKKTAAFLNLEHPTFAIPKTFGQRASDNLTKWAGSWTFIILFGIFIILWMILNTSWLLFGQGWDIYPFILLNLALSCVAAVQAPIILMSQNREGQKDRQRAQYDYAVNRKAEKEISQIQIQLNRIEKKLRRK
jgi:uncharacterized membrane protein